MNNLQPPLRLEGVSMIFIHLAMISPWLWLKIPYRRPSMMTRQSGFMPLDVSGTMKTKKKMRTMKADQVWLLTMTTMICSIQVIVTF